MRVLLVNAAASYVANAAASYVVEQNFEVFNQNQSSITFLLALTHLSISFLIHLILRIMNILKFSPVEIASVEYHPTVKVR